MSALPTLSDVKSSNIASIGHDGTDLFVKFLSGPVWRYAKVPADVFEQMKAAPSIGRFFGSVIKPKYEATKVNG